MVTRNLSRVALLALIKDILGAEMCTPNPFGKNSHIFSNGEDDIAQVGFISKSQSYTYIIYMRGISTFLPDGLHEKVCQFVLDANLGRTICVDSEYKRSIV